MQILNETLYLITMACLQKEAYDKRYYKKSEFNNELQSTYRIRLLKGTYGILNGFIIYIN